MRSTLIIIYVLGGVLLGAFAAPATAETTVDVEHSAQSVEQVVVTAKRATVDALHLNAPAADLPIAIQVIPIQTIQDQGFVRLGDAIRDVSDVVRKEAYFGLTDSFGIRGFDASTGLFNGFRHDYYGQVVDIAHVQSVEVIKGPASVTTGFLEPGGVVNTITKRPSDDPATAVSLQGGSYGFGRAEVDVSRKLNDLLALRLTDGAETTNSFRDFVASSRYSTGGALDWTPTSKTKIGLSLYYTYAHATPHRGLADDPISLTISPDRFFWTGQGASTKAVLVSKSIGVDYTRQKQRYQFFDTDINGAFVAPIYIFVMIWLRKRKAVALYNELRRKSWRHIQPAQGCIHDALP